MKKLSIYFTPSYFSVQIANGVTRETKGDNPAVVLDAMPAEDRKVFEAFCRAVVEYAGTKTFPTI